MSTGSPGQQLAIARAAFEHHDWDSAYRAFARARSREPLPIHDLDAMGDAAWWLGLAREAMSLSEEVHRRCVEAGERSRAAMAAMDIGFMAILRGEVALGSGWLGRARRLLDDLPTAVEHGYLRMMAIEEASDAGDLAAAITAAREVHALGRDHGDPTLQALALVQEGTSTVQQGHMADGLALLDEAMVSVVAGEVRPEFAGNIYCRMMSLCHDLVDLRRAREWTTATQRWCDTFSSAAMFTGICRVHRAQLLVVAGDWGSAEAEARRVCEDLAELNVAVVGEAWYQRAELSRLRGDLDVAEAGYREALARGRDPQPGLALLWLADGRPREGLSAVTSSLEGAGPDPFRRARLLAAQADLAVACGDGAVAAGAADALATIAGTWPTPGLEALAEQARGAALLVADDPAGALRSLRGAESRWQAMDAPLQTALTRRLASRARAALGDERGARLEADVAMDALDRMRSTSPPDGARQPAGAGLTAREVEVLALVAEGATNRQVADSLVISEKTVARHLANIYLKLDLRTRTAAAAWAHRNGIGAS